MIKKIAKRIVKSALFSTSRICVDYIYADENSTVLSGWFFHKETNVPRSIELLGKGGEPFDIDVVYFGRADVTNQYSLPSTEHCFGYLIIVNTTNLRLKDLSAVVGGKSYSLSWSKPLHTSSLIDLVNQATTEASVVKSFVENLGFKVPLDTSMATVARVKDKDIERIKDILIPVNIHENDFFTNCVNDYLPRLQKIWSARVRKSNHVIVKNYGDLVSEPKVSVIVPLYGRYDFVQHQIAQFNSDPDFQQVELIYVLDDPTLKHVLSVTAVGIYETFGLPFKIIYSEQNLGFAGANNLGVEHARSAKILLLNSDILPSKSGWLGTMIDQFDSADNCGVLGATLVYEDETIQHCGMEFREDSNYPGIWMNHHPYKGIPLALVENFEIKPASLTTGACMLMNKELYQEVEGFNPMYVLGDFEDSDLCLKCIQKGYKIYVSGKVKLYHLERLSQDLVDTGDWKFKLTLANGVYQSSRWSDLIKELAS